MAPAFLPTALSVALRPLFPFQQAGILKFSAEVCAILQALQWSRQHQQVCHFSSLLLLSDSSSVLATLSPPQSFLWQVWRNCLLSPPVLLDYSGSPNTRFSRGTTRLMSWPDGERYSCPQQSLVVSLVSTLLCSRTGGVLSHQNSSIHRFPRFPRGAYARCVLSRLRCNGYSLLLSSYLSRIGRVENSSCSACGHPSQDSSHLILHCPATGSLHRSLFGDFLPFYDLWSRPWEFPRLLGLHGLSPCPHSYERVGKQQHLWVSSHRYMSLRSTKQFSQTQSVNKTAITQELT